MTFYIILLFSPLLLRLLIPKNNRAFFVCIFLLIFICIGFRSFSVGADTSAYQQIFETISNNSIDEYLATRKTEILFVCFTKIISILFNQSFRLYLISCALVFSFLLSLVIFYSSKYQAISWYYVIAFSTLVYGLSGLRSSFGLVFGCLGSLFIFNKQFSQKKNSLFYYLLLSLIASLFHYTALVYFFLFPLYKLKKTKLYYFYYFCLCISLVVTSKNIFPILATHFFPMKNYSYSSSSGYGLLVITFLMHLFLKLTIPKHNRNKDLFIIESCLLEFVFALQLVALNFSLWSRISQFIFTLALIYYPNCIQLTFFSKRDKQIIYFLSCVILFLYYFNGLLVDSSKIIPYEFM